MTRTIASATELIQFDTFMQLHVSSLQLAGSSRGESVNKLIKTMTRNPCQ